MRKSILSASIAAMIGGLGLAGVASASVFAPNNNVGAPGLAANVQTLASGNAATALTVDNTGIGHILVVPYYTTQGTNATLFNIVNTDTTNGKLVKVRVRGASNSDDLFDFQLFLSPGDVWAAKLSQDANGVSQLQTSDATCTLPSTVRTQANSFNVGATSRLNPALSATAKANETREGYIEILNMADIPKNSTADQNVATTGQTTNPLFTAIKHVSGVAPCTTAAFNPLLTDATVYSDSTSASTAAASLTGKGLVFPTGQLFANFTIIDTVRTATFGGTASAVRATNGGTNAVANAVFFPQLTNTVASASVNGYTSDPLFRTDSLRIASGQTAVAAGTTAIIAATQQDFPDLSTPYTATSTTSGGVGDTTNAPDARLQASNLSASLQAKSVVNEFLTTTSIAATTDWVFSMPTRRYNVAMNYAYTNPLGGNGRVYSDYNAQITAGPPVVTVGGTNFFTSANTTVNSAGQICVASASLTPFDREENTSSLGFTISPGAATTVSFCGEVSVLAVNNGTAATSGSLAASVALSNLNLSTSVGTANEGWMTISTTGLDTTTTAAWPNAAWAAPSVAARANGLPVVGAAFAKSTSFGAVWNHRYSR